MKRITKPLAITMGDPSGIGLELLLGLVKYAEDLPPLCLFADPDLVRTRAEPMGVAVREIALPEQASAISACSLAVMPIPFKAFDRIGEPETANAPAIIGSIDAAVEAVMTDKAAAVVTLPISKKPLYDAGFTHPGHTEYLAELAERHTGQAAQPVMMIAAPDLRTVPITIHLPLREAITQLTTELCVRTGRIVARDLKTRFGLDAPRLVFAGLNPHAGEGGALGEEDDAIIAPAVAQLISEGINAAGPLPADTLFHARARAQYDVALCGYHDQALIPPKTLAVDDGVNVTLGLPFIRTSPDHGTAFDIAGQGIARPDSLHAAIRMAWDMANHEAAS